MLNAPRDELLAERYFAAGGRMLAPPRKNAPRGRDISSSQNRNSRFAKTERTASQKRNGPVRKFANVESLLSESKGRESIESEVGDAAPTDDATGDPDTIRTQIDGQKFRGWSRVDVALAAGIDPDRFVAFMRGSALSSDDKARLSAAWPTIATTHPPRGSAAVA